MNTFGITLCKGITPNMPTTNWMGNMEHEIGAKNLGYIILLYKNSVNYLFLNNEYH